MAKLSDYVSIKASSKKLVGDDFWLLNLDMVEQQTGRVIEYNRVSADKLDGSIIQFDTDCVLYSKLRPNLNKVVLPEIDGYATSEMLPLRPDTSVLSREYLAEYLRSDHFVTWAISKTAGAKMPRLGSKELLSKELHIPSLEEQAHIVALFQRIAELIDTKKQELELLDKLVKSRFIELFGDPNTNPMKWKKEQLQINAILLNGRAYKQDELLDDGKYPVLRVGNFFSNRGWYYSDLELDEDKYCDDGDLLYAWSASFGPRIWNGGKVIYHYHIWKVLVGEKYNKQFLCHLLDYATASFMGDTHGIGMMHLTKSGMEETEFIVPPIDLQNQFTAFVEQTDKSKLAVQNSIAELEELKKSLMQKYFG